MVPCASEKAGTAHRGHVDACSRVQSLRIEIMLYGIKSKQAVELTSTRGLGSRDRARVRNSCLGSGTSAKTT